ncbi:MAG: A/G-specific adenine glycosylase [Myxococcota bacterium]|nr:A/G-specific adenine glycosylase [Myxococcota bacterium]
MSELSPSLKQLRAQLLDWYDEHRRTMPWREHPSPWGIWVSEIMLQQTRVDSVIDYYHRFMDRYPTPRALAESSLDELLGFWAGLGYYARARNLHRAAQVVVAEHGGKVPADPGEFRQLVGVGAYTCGAVQSIAFGHPMPVVDGNVIRVIARLDDCHDDPKKSAVQKKFWARATELLDHDRPGDFNQAMMELGATVCTPKRPSCLLCPVKSHCRGLRSSDVETLPRKAPRKKPPTLDRVAGLCTDDQGRIWIGRRPENGLLGGLWGLPSMPGQAPEKLRELQLQPGQHRSTITHAFTHQIWRVSTYSAVGRPVGGPFTAYRAVEPASLGTMGLTGPSLKALRASGIDLPHRRGAGRVSPTDALKG